MSFLKAPLSFLGLLISVISALIVLVSAIYQPTKTQICITLFLFLAPLVVALLSRKWALILFLGSLPLLANLDTMVWTYGSILVRSPLNAGLNLAAGFFIGIFVSKLLDRGVLDTAFAKLINFAPPWQFGLFACVITTSAIVGIVRNSWQSASYISIPGILFNLKYFQGIGWHDDFRPITDWVAYGMLIAVATAVIAALRSVQNRNQVFFRPLLIGLFLSGLMGIFQARTGVGISPGFRVDGLGFPAYGFHPDLHAYAGYIALGAVGLFGYLSVVKSAFEKRIVFLVILISWAGLVLSKSRISLALSLLFLLLLLGAYFYQKKSYRKYFGWIIFGLFVGIPAITCLTYLALPAGLLSWPAELVEQISKLDFGDFYQVSATLGNRPELYLAALRMIKALPFMGVGLGDFYHMSSNIQLTGSQLLATINGENAHNYFLQTFAENGVVGVFTFIVLIASPILAAKPRYTILPAGIAFASLLLGNIYAHAFLVRENLLLAATILALMYLEASPKLGNIHQHSKISLSTRGVSKLKLPIMIFAVAVLIIGSSREIYQSLYRFPYEYGSLCFVPKDLSHDKWSSGIYQIDVPANAKSISVPITINRPSLDTQPLKIEMQLVGEGNQVLISQDSILQEITDLNLRLEIPEEILRKSTKKIIRLKLSSCFTPRNLGLSLDGRRLGVQVSSPKFLN
jgi:O-antigen ligase